MLELSFNQFNTNDKISGGTVHAVSKSGKIRLQISVCPKKEVNGIGTFVSGYRLAWQGHGGANPEYVKLFIEAMQFAQHHADKLTSCYSGAKLEQAVSLKPNIRQTALAGEYHG